MTTHSEARAIVARALLDELGREPWLSECYAVQGVSWLETQYGQGWKPPGVGSNNWGAVQSTKPWRDAGGTEFSYTDTHPNADGSSTPYRIGFRIYATPLDGARDVASLLKRMGVVGDSGVAHVQRTVYAVSERLYQARYYEGFGKTREQRIANHSNALGGAVALAARELGEQPGLALRAPLPTDRIVPVRLGPDLPGPAPVVPLTDEQIAAQASWAVDPRREGDQ